MEKEFISNVHYTKIEWWTTCLENWNISSTIWKFRARYILKRFKPLCKY